MNIFQLSKISLLRYHWLSISMYMYTEYVEFLENKEYEI